MKIFERMGKLLESYYLIKEAYEWLYTSIYVCMYIIVSQSNQQKVNLDICIYGID